MSFPIPELDTLNFEQLLEQAKGLIPRFAPAWTDHNVHDPGITLLELLAWLSDQLMFNVGSVSDAHLQAFAALVQTIDDRPTPATGLVWPGDNVFVNDPFRAGLTLDAGSALALIANEGVPVEVARAVHLSCAQIKAFTLVNTASGEPQSDPGLSLHKHFARWSEPRALFSGSRSLALEISFSGPLVNCGYLTSHSRASTLPLALAFEISNARPAPANAAYDTALAITHSFHYPDAPGAPEPLAIIEDDTRGFTRTGTIIVAAPIALAEQVSAGEDPVLPSSTLAISATNALPSDVYIHRFSLNVLPVVQQQSVAPALLSNAHSGNPGALIPFDSRGAISEIQLDTRHCDDGEHWRPVAGLASAGPFDKVFVIDSSSAQLCFGNGINGFCPPANSQFIHRGFKRSLGASGNINAGKRWKLQHVTIVQSAEYGVNPEAIDGGADAASLIDQQNLARQAAFERFAAVTNEHLLSRAQEQQWLGIGRVDVKVLEDDMASGQRRQVVYVAEPFARPSQDLLSKKLTQALYPHRLLGETLLVTPAEPVGVTIDARLRCQDNIDKAQLKSALEQVLSARLSELPAPGSDIEPWPIGRSVSKQEMESLLVSVDGVAEVRVTRLAKTSPASEEDPQRLTLASHEIAVFSALTIEHVRGQGFLDNCDFKAALEALLSADTPELAANLSYLDVEDEPGANRNTTHIIQRRILFTLSTGAVEAARDSLYRLSLELQTINESISVEAH